MSNKFVIKGKSNVTSRGTEGAKEIKVCLLVNWEEIQIFYKEKSEEERDELIEYFNGEVSDFGDTLFG